MRDSATNAAQDCEDLALSYRQPLRKPPILYRDALEKLGERAKRKSTALRKFNSKMRKITPEREQLTRHSRAYLRTGTVYLAVLVLFLSLLGYIVPVSCGEYVVSLSWPGPI